ALDWRHLTFGLLCTWIVGVGRYWDNPRVGLLQHLGVGSVIYVFVLSLFLWLIVWPLRPKDWGYFRVLTFISLVSPPAILYAIPVEKWDLDAANSINSLFLLIVALWRVALLVFFLRRSGELDPLSIIVATFLPLTMIVIGLSMLNLEQAVFNFMGGLRDRTPNDSAFGIVMLLSLISFLLFIPLVIGYAVMVAVNTAHARQQRLLKELDDNH
ncbi:MAG TPA: hypothetical protein VIJ87_02125, partial [Pyrinomonadaceae bacterium]